MNEPEMKSDAANPGLEELQGELQSLRTLVSVVLIALIVLCVSAGYYLVQQIRAQNAGIAQAQQVVESFPAATATEFLNKLKEYSKTHPDFAPIAAKYNNLFNPPAPAKK